MVRAGWLDHYRVEPRSGVIATWSELGCRRKKMLGHVIHTLGFDQEPIESFDLSNCSCARHGMHVADFEESARAFWVACMEELRIEMDPGAVRAFVRILCAEETRPRECLVRLESSATLPANGHGIIQPQPWK